MNVFQKKSDIRALAYATLKLQRESGLSSASARRIPKSYWLHDVTGGKISLFA